uniref:Uncharacterized protein n=1 Tax=candidate division WWE3 bacterium TaxID=2053526 RepID=A0A831Z0N4_UNCKA
MDGIMRCSRYAFGPNRLHYCGPDANRQILSHIQEEAGDPDLRRLLAEFQTMYPYLLHIAHANGIADPFAERVVEAYWIGNELLENISQKQFYRHLREGLQLKNRLGGKAFDRLTKKIEQGAVPHHSFHVLDIWKRTGHEEREHTLESMDSCRVSWGEVTQVQGPEVTVSIEPLLYAGGKLYLGDPVSKTFRRNLEAEFDIEQLQPGQIVTIHWGVLCESIRPRQAAFLRRYTLRHIELANQTL